MIGQLPSSLTIAGREYAIESDFRPWLYVMSDVFNDKDLDEPGKLTALIACVYKEFPEDEYADEAIRQAIWFLNCGNVSEDENPDAKPIKRYMDWEQDELYIFAAIAEVAGFDVRAADYVHWWTFMGYYMSISGDSVFSSITHIRKKIKNRQKLDKYEREFLRDNRSTIILKKDKEEAEALRKEAFGE